MNKLLVLCFLVFSTQLYAVDDSLVGKWRGTIIGHIDSKDYFLNASISSIKNENYLMQLKIFSGDYEGEFLITTTLKNNRLYIDSIQKRNEFPFAYQHIEDCFTGYFQIKHSENKTLQLDLYRNPIYRNIDDFTKKDNAGNFVPSFECFTSVLLQPVLNDTTYKSLEKQTDSLLAIKKIKTQEVTKRKTVSAKTCIVKNNSVTLQVWDNNKEDGDIVSLKLNDAWILTNFLLKKEKYSIHLDLQNKENTLLLFAENLGSIPPNTAAISIEDNGKTQTFILNSDMRKSEAVKIIVDQNKK